MKNQHRAVLITGCSSGIGLAAAKILQNRGYQVFPTVRNEADVAALEAQGFSKVFTLDVTDSLSIKTAVDGVLAITGGKLYALFNNAGYGQPGALADLPTAALRSQFETNIFGAHELTNRIIPVMRAQGEGRIIQNSSVLGIVAFKYRGAYNASKFALEGLSDTLRLELAGTGIHVSIIQPGPIDTKFRANSLAAFNRNIDREGSHYQGVYDKMAERLAVEGPAVALTLPAEAVVKKLIHALESRSPKARYGVTVHTHVFSFLKRILSTKMLDWILSKA